MTSYHTLISELDSKPPVTDKNDDLVHQILADMNTASPSNPVMSQSYVPERSSGGNRVISSPNPNSTYHHSPDVNTATAHLIGTDRPTTADFANLINTSGESSYGMQQPMMSHSPYQPPMYDNPNYSQYQPQNQYPQYAPQLASIGWKDTFYSDIISHLKQPLLVAIIIFITSLPIVNVLFGYYMPSLLRMGGDLTMIGVVLKSLLGGVLYWFIQKVLVPLCTF
jgi:hypothetical protein